MSILILMLAATLGAEPAPPAAVVAFDAPPPTTPPDREVFTPPDWSRKPTGSEVSSYYPETAGLFGKPGKATINCSVSATGELSDCVLLDESPLELGFGQAALEMAPHFHMKPALIDGKPVGGYRVTIPLSFTQPPDKFPGLTDSLSCYGRFTVRTRLNPADAEFVEPARRARRQANWLMRLKRMSKELRDSRLEAEVRSAGKAVLAGQPLDAKTQRCLKLFAE